MVVGKWLEKMADLQMVDDDTVHVIAAGNWGREEIKMISRQTVNLYAFGFKKVRTSELSRIFLSLHTVRELSKWLA